MTEAAGRTRPAVIGLGRAWSFWLSHVPPERLPAFWNTVAMALAPGGKAVFIDDGPAAAAEEQVLTDESAPAALRRLDDGSRYRIVKVFHDAQGPHRRPHGSGVVGRHPNRRPELRRHCGTAGAR